MSDNVLPDIEIWIQLGSFCSLIMTTFIFYLNMLPY